MRESATAMRGSPTAMRGSSTVMRAYEVLQTICKRLLVQREDLLSILQHLLFALIPVAFIGTWPPTLSHSAVVLQFYNP